jgi:cytochrome c biogenesis protein CcmG/thiol:disulfide interchange protein DsbE
VTRRLGLALLLLAVLVSGCSSPGSSSSPGAGRAVGPPCLPAGSAPAGSSAAASVRLTCFDGGAPASLAALGKPAIVNLWAAWCEPCRTELPAIQQFADRAGDRVKVIGVATADSHASAQSFIEDNKLTMTMLEDPDRRLLTAVHRSALPATLFITAGGTLAFVYNSTPLDVDHVADLAERYLGVTVPA